MNSDIKENVKVLFEYLRETERCRTCGDDAIRRYHKIHAYRFHKTLKICKQLLPNPHVRVLDVGPSHLTKLLAQEYKSVFTIGLDSTTDNGGQQNISTIALNLPHITFELNNSQYPDRWPDINQSFDLIVYAETIEHLSTAPEYSLVFLRNLLAENGILLITTPNAAMIMKRLILLLKGNNPYERIRLFAENPGHFREYTMRELIAIGARCQLDSVHAKHVNFYSSANLIQGFLKNIKPTFRDSLVVAFRKQATQCFTMSTKGKEL